MTPSLTENQVIETDMKLQVNETNVKPVTKKGFPASSFNGKSGVAHRFLDAAEEIEST